ncbi:FAD-dependent oxidoreductase [Agrobacterium rhizogenes]|nr:FAD-dependent oxidoreductase [Rhizobium rhizogenes]
MATCKATSANTPEADVLIVGAGIIGLALGLSLQLAGKRVTIIDRDEPARGASFGNAGYLAQGNIFPPASPDVLKQLPALLFDRNGPLVVKPDYLSTLIPWGMRLLSAARPKRQAEIIDALSSLNRRAIASYQPLLKAAQAEDLFEARGSLVLCRTEAALAQKRNSIPALHAHGIDVEEISREGILALEPSVSSDIAGGLHYPGNVHCLSPGQLGARFAQAIRGNGGDILKDRVTRIRPTDGGWRADISAGSLNSSKLVVCAGWWSADLMRPLGYTIPLASERGYHLMLPEPGIALNRPVVMAEHYFAAAPMQDGIRLAGTAEFASPDSAMNPGRSDILHGLAEPYLPGLSVCGATRWMGVRPSFPDALPAIGIAEHHPGLFYSFGHQHVGLTQAAISARLLADRIVKGSFSEELTPFSLSRFSS